MFMFLYLMVPVLIITAGFFLYRQQPKNAIICLLMAVIAFLGAGIFQGNHHWARVAIENKRLKQKVKELNEKLEDKTSGADIVIKKYTNEKGYTFRNFKFVLTPKNTILPSDKRIKSLGYSRNADNYHMEILDEHSFNFKENGQFEIFIPKDKFPLKNSSKKYIIARMPQTNLSYKDAQKYIKSKQQLFYKISSIVKNRKGSVDVVFEYPNANDDSIGANIYFRHYKGQYINYDGKLITHNTNGEKQ